MDGPAAAGLAATLYAVLLLPLAAVSAWRLRQLGSGTMAPERVRLRQAQVWLGLLSLASFRSPFVPDAYALFGTLWLLTLVAAEGHWQWRGRIALVVGGAIATIVLDGGPISVPVPAWILMVTLVVQLAAIAFNAAIVLTPGRGRAPGADCRVAWRDIHGARAAALPAAAMLVADGIFGSAHLASGQ